MYEHYFNFREKPFSLLPDPDFLYLGEQHKMALYMLRYGVTNQAGFIVVTGEVGCGKTILVRQLLNELEVDSSIGLISDTHQSQGEILHRVLMAFNLDYSDANRATLYARLVDFLVTEYSQNRRVVLIVDEAQNMDAANLEELRTLSNVNADKHQLIQLLLLGQPELRDTLRQTKLRQFAQRISVYYHLEPLKEQQTFDYIRHRLAVVGGDPTLFTEGACAVVHKHSLGVPRLINRLCDTALLYGYGGYKTSIDQELVASVARDLSKGGLTGLPEFPKSIVDYAPRVNGEHSASEGRDSAFTPPKPATVLDGFNPSQVRLAPKPHGPADNGRPLRPDLLQPHPAHAAGAQATPVLKVAKESKLHSVAPLMREAGEREEFAIADRSEDLATPGPPAVETKPAGSSAGHAASQIEPLVSRPLEPPATSRQGSQENRNRIWIGALIVLFVVAAIGLAIYEHTGLSLFGYSASRETSPINDEFWNSALPGGVQGVAMREQINELLVQASEQRQAGALEAALGTINQVLVFLPDNAELKELRAALEKGIRDRERQRAKAARRSREVASLASVARELSQAGDLEGARAAVDRGLSLDPDNVELRILGENVDAARARREQEAEETRRRRVEIVGFLKAAKVQQSRGEFDQALVSVTQGLALDPENAELGRLLRTLRAQMVEQQRRQDPDDNKTQLPDQGKLDANPDLEEARTGLRERQPEKAVLAEAADTSFDPASRDGKETINQPQPQNAPVREKRRVEIAQFVEQAKVERDNGNLDLAVMSVNQALELAPGNVELEVLLRELRAELAEQERAEETRRQQEIAVSVDRARQLRASGKLEASLQTVDSALADAPGSKVLQELKVELEVEEAGRQEVVRLTETARQQLQSGDLRPALDTVEQVLVLDADNQSLVQLRTMLQASIRDQERQKAEEERLARELETLMVKAHELERAGRLDEARDVVQRGLTLAADDSELHALDEHISEAMAQRELRAKAEFERRQEIMRLVAQAENEPDSGQIDKAIASVNQGLGLYPDNTALTELSAELHAALAKRKRRAAEDERQRQISALVAEVDRLIEAGQIDQAADMQQRGLKLYRNNPELVGLGERVAAANTQRARASAAERRMRAEIDQLVEKAKAQRVGGEPRLALASVDHALTMYPDQPLLSQLQLQLRTELAEAERQEAETARLRGERAALVDEVKQQLARSDLEAARRDVNEGLKSDPSHAELRSLEADLEAAADRRREAAAVLQPAQSQREAGQLKVGLASVNEGLAQDPGSHQLSMLRAAPQTQASERRRADEAGQPQELRAIVVQAQRAQASADVVQLRASVAKGLVIDPENEALLALKDQAAPTVATVDASPRISRYVVSGDRYLAQGDVASARLFYEVAAATGNAQAILAVGATYDPVVIGQRRLHVHTDALQAARWYRRALEAGADEAQLRLQSLARWHKQNERRFSAQRSAALRSMLTD